MCFSRRYIGKRSKYSDSVHNKFVATIKTTICIMYAIQHIGGTGRSDLLDRTNSLHKTTEFSVPIIKTCFPFLFFSIFFFNCFFSRKKYAITVIKFKYVTQRSIVSYSCNSRDGIIKKNPRSQRRRQALPVSDIFVR